MVPLFARPAIHGWLAFFQEGRVADLYFLLFSNTLKRSSKRNCTWGPQLKVVYGRLSALTIHLASISRWSNSLLASFHGSEQAMSEGWRHPDGKRAIFHLLYTLENPPPVIRQICVPLAPDGNSAVPGISTLNGKPIVTTKPGDLLIHNGKRERVATGNGRR